MLVWIDAWFDPSLPYVSTVRDGVGKGGKRVTICQTCITSSLTALFWAVWRKSPGDFLPVGGFYTVSSRNPLTGFCNEHDSEGVVVWEIPGDKDPCGVEVSEDSELLRLKGSAAYNGRLGVGRGPFFSFSNGYRLMNVSYYTPCIDLASKSRLGRMLIRNEMQNHKYIVISLKIYLNIVEGVCPLLAQ